MILEKYEKKTNQYFYTFYIYFYVKNFLYFIYSIDNNTYIFYTHVYNYYHKIRMETDFYFLETIYNKNTSLNKLKKVIYYSCKKGKIHILLLWLCSEFLHHENKKIFSSKR